MVLMSGPSGYESDDNDENTPLLNPIPNACNQALQQFVAQQPSSRYRLSSSTSVSNFGNPDSYLTGLFYLEGMETVLIHKKVDDQGILNKMIDKFFIKNIDSEISYFVIENSSVYDRLCYRSCREINLNACDMTSNKIFKINRSMDYECCCFPIFLQHFEVLSPNNDLLGVVDQERKLFTLSLLIRDGNGMILFRIIRHHIKEISCCRDTVYKIFLTDGETEVGLITKHKKSTLDGYNPCYTLNFPHNINITMKVLLIASLFTVHYMYYD